MPRNRIAGSCGFIPSFFKESPYHLPQWLEGWDGEGDGREGPKVGDTGTPMAYSC